MKKVIFGSALMICGMIGISSVIISYTIAVTGELMSAGIVYGGWIYGLGTNLIPSLIIFILLTLSGAVISLTGIREKK